VLAHLPARSFGGCGHYSDRSFACQENCCATAQFAQNAILWAMKIISTTEAARRLKVSPSRIRAMIGSGRLKAIKVGKVWLIDPKDLDAVKDRKVGRPRKVRKTSKS
jgi:excisionase family DNA binding protein